MRADTRFLGRFARVTLLVTADAMAVAGAAACAYLFWALPMRDSRWASTCSWRRSSRCSFSAMRRPDFIPGFGLGPVETLRRLSYVTAFGFLDPGGVLLRVEAAAALFARHVRAGVRLQPRRRCRSPACWSSALARRWPWWSEPVVVVGTGERAARAIRSIQQPATSATGPPRCWPSRRRSDPDRREVEGVPVVGGLDEAPALAAARHPRRAAREPPGRPVPRARHDRSAAAATSGTWC